MAAKANKKNVGGDHYGTHELQHWDYVVANDIPYLEAMAIRYIQRHLDKGGLEDLEKAEHFIQKLKEVHYDA